MQGEGKPKKNAVNAALDRVKLLAKKRGESLTEEIKAAINAKADSTLGEEVVAIADTIWKNGPRRN
jgi:hypothetical protein